MANSIDPDQTPRSAGSDLGLHCLGPSNSNTSSNWIDSNTLQKFTHADYSRPWQVRMVKTKINCAHIQFFICYMQTHAPDLGCKSRSPCKLRVSCPFHTSGFRGRIQRGSVEPNISWEILDTVYTLNFTPLTLYLIQSILVIPTLDTMTKFVILTIWLGWKPSLKRW